MNGYSKIITSDNLLFYGLIASLALLSLHLIVVLLSYAHLPPIIPLLNQMPWGEARLIKKPQIFLPLGIAASMLLVNTVLSVYLYKRMPLVSRILTIGGFITALFSLLLIIRTVLIIG